MSAAKVDRLTVAQEELDRILAARGDAELGLAAARRARQQADEELLRLDGLESSIALGEIDAGDVTELRATATYTLEASIGEAKRYTAVIKGLAGRVESAEQELLEAGLDRLLEQRAQETERRDAVAEVVEATLAGAIAPAAELKQIRSGLEFLQIDIRNLETKLGRAATIPRDESAWRPFGWESFVSFVHAGPSMPNSVSAVGQAARNAEDRRRLHDRIVEAAKDSLAGIEPMETSERVALQLVKHGIGEEHAPAVLAERERLIEEHLAADRARVDLARASWAAAGAEAPEMPLSETEMRWRAAHGIPIEGDEEAAARAAATTAASDSRIRTVAERMADYGIDDNSQWLKTVPEDRRDETIQLAREIRRDRLGEFERRQVRIHAQNLEQGVVPSSAERAR